MYNPDNLLGPHKGTNKGNDPNHISYHHPIGNAGAIPGADRLVTIQPNAPNSQYELGVSYRGTTKPLGKGGNHPFSQSIPWMKDSAILNKMGANVEMRATPHAWHNKAHDPMLFPT